MKHIDKLRILLVGIGLGLSTGAAAIFGSDTLYPSDENHNILKKFGNMNLKHLSKLNPKDLTNLLEERKSKGFFFVYAKKNITFKDSLDHQLHLAGNYKSYGLISDYQVIHTVKDENEITGKTIIDAVIIVQTPFSSSVAKRVFCTSKNDRFLKGKVYKDDMCNAVKSRIKYLKKTK